nr:uncharacterized protein LOC115846091 [Globicephala melas]
MCSDRNAQTLLVGMQDGAAALEDSKPDCPPASPSHVHVLLDHVEAVASLPRGRRWSPSSRPPASRADAKVRLPKSQATGQVPVDVAGAPQARAGSARVSPSSSTAALRPGAAPQPHPLILESCSYNCLCQEQGGSRTGPGKHLAGAGLQHPLLETNSARIWKQPECSTLEVREGGWRRPSVGCSVLGQTVRGHLGPVTTRGQGALSQSHHGAAGPGCERRSARTTAGGADGETEAPRGKQGPDKLGLVTPAPHPAWTLEHRAGLGEAGGIRLQPRHACTRGRSRFPEGAGPASTLRPAPCSSPVGRECGEVTLATPGIWRGRQHHGREPRPHGSLRTSVLPLLTLVLCSGKVLLPRCLLTAGQGHPESGTCSWESRGDLANWEVASPGPAPFLRLRASSGLPAAAQLLGGLPPAFLSLQGQPLGAPRLQGGDCSP